MLNNGGIHIVDRPSIQKNSLDPLLNIFRAQAKLLEEECLDAAPGLGFHHETLLE
jgi:hypothetical protein